MKRLAEMINPLDTLSSQNRDVQQKESGQLQI